MRNRGEKERKRKKRIKEETAREGKTIGNRGGKKVTKKKKVGECRRWKIERKREKRGEKRRKGDIQISLSSTHRVRTSALCKSTHNHTILGVLHSLLRRRFTRVPLTTAENDVEETFVWQLARRRRRRDVFRIRKPAFPLSVNDESAGVSRNFEESSSILEINNPTQRCVHVRYTSLETIIIYDSSLVHFLFFFLFFFKFPLFRKKKRIIAYLRKCLSNRE